MVVMEVPKIVKRRIRWVRVVIEHQAVTCADAAIRKAVEALRPIGGPPTDDPEPDWTLGRECRLWLHARIIEQTPTGKDGPEIPGLCLSPGGR